MNGERLGSAEDCSLTHFYWPVACKSDGMLDDWSLGDGWKRRSVTVDMFRFLLFTVGGRDCHSFMNRKERGFNLQIHVLP